jgi:hypothetical protein
MIRYQYMLANKQLNKKQDFLKHVILDQKKFTFGTLVFWLMMGGLAYYSGVIITYI